MFLLRDDKPFIPYPNMIDIIGGHMDPGETPLETTMRELSEELIEAETGAPMRPIVEPDFPKFGLDAVKAIDLGFGYYNGNVVISETEAGGCQYHAFYL